MENKIRVGINGFGRIGRCVARLIANHPKLELVAINDLADAPTLVHLFKYDSVHGHFKGTISIEDDVVLLNGNKVYFSQHKNPDNILWNDHKVDVVLESTGLFKTQELCKAHLKPGVKKVIISAPSSDTETNNIVIGVNHELLNPEDKIISNASCTTNCAAPMVKIIDENLGVESAYITTIHSYTSDQRLHDAPHKDLRRARAAALSMVPTTTGAAKALSRVFPHLKGHLGGCGIRVPVPNGSLTDITFLVKKESSVEEINNLFKKASNDSLKGILGYTEEPLVSIDIVGSSYSCLIDSQLTSVLGKMVKIVGWYDNEMGYSCRLVDLILKVSE